MKTQFVRTFVFALSSLGIAAAGFYLYFELASSPRDEDRLTAASAVAGGNDVHPGGDSGASTPGSSGSPTSASGSSEARFARRPAGTPGSISGITRGGPRVAAAGAAAPAGAGSRQGRVTEPAFSGSASPGRTSVPLAERMNATRAERIRETMNPYFGRAGFSESERDQTVGILDEYVRSAGQRNPEARARTEQQLAEILGPERASEVMALQNSMGSRVTIVADFATRSAAQGVHVSDETMDALSVSTYESQLNLALPAGRQKPVTAEEYRGLTVFDPGTIEAASKILTPQQLEIFKQSLAERFPVEE